MVAIAKIASSCLSLKATVAHPTTKPSRTATPKIVIAGFRKIAGFAVACRGRVSIHHPHRVAATGCAAIVPNELFRWRSSMRSPPPSPSSTLAGSCAARATRFR